MSEHNPNQRKLLSRGGAKYLQLLAGLKITVLQALTIDYYFKEKDTGTYINSFPLSVLIKKIYQY
jgi:hypothetical protein